MTIKMFIKSDGATLLEPDEIQGLKFPHVNTRSELNHLEQANIQQGIMWSRTTKKDKIISASFIRELHRRLFGDVWSWAGKFRTSEKNIGIDPLNIATQLKLLLDDFNYWIECNSYPALEASLRLHHRLVMIHLFPNGNGRHARIYTDIILNNIFQLPGIDWAGGYKTTEMEQRRKQYINALRLADNGDYNKLIGNFKLLVMPT